MIRHLLFLSALTLAACGSKDDSGAIDTDTTATGTGTGAATGTGTGSATGGPSWVEVRDDIIVPSCGLSSCHGTSAQAGLMVDETTEPSALVDAPSTQKAGAILVIAGDSAGSYFMQKIVDAPGIEGDPMPPPFGDLDQALQDKIAAWIDAGAQ